MEVLRCLGATPIASPFIFEDSCMSGFFSGRNVATNRSGGVRLPPVIDSACPLLSEALQGEYDAQAKAFTGPAYTLSVWQEGSFIKFVLGAGENFPKFFSSFQGLDAGFESIEKILQSGGGNWVLPKPPKLR